MKKIFWALALLSLLIPSLAFGQSASIVQFLLSGLNDSQGNPLNGGKVYTDVAGGTSQKTCWIDKDEVTPAAYPVVLNTYGRAQLYCDGWYKFVVTDANDVTIATWDNLFFPSLVTSIGNPGYDYNIASEKAIRTAINAQAGWVNVKDPAYGAKGDGVTDDRTAIQAALTAANSAGGGIVFVPAANYYCSGALTIYKKTTLIGAGVSSILTFDHTGDGINSTWPINSSTAVNIGIRNLKLINTNGSNTGGGFVDVGGSYVDLDGIFIQGFKYGAIFDQTEISHVTRSIIQGQLTGGIWLVNGADHTAGALTNYTNQIVIDKCQFNETTGVYNIIDDGGSTHVIQGTNFNGGASPIRMAGVYGFSIIGSQSEGHAEGILFQKTSLAGTAIADSFGGIIAGNILEDYAASYCVGVDFVHGLNITGNTFAEYVGAAVLLLNTTSNVSTNIRIGENSKAVTGAGKTSAKFLDGSAGPSAGVDITGQMPMTYVQVAQASGVQTVTPQTMEMIYVNSTLICMNADGTNAETVLVTSVGSTTFTATFASAKTGNWLVLGSSRNPMANFPLTALGGGAAPTLGTIGGSGPTSAAQNSWALFKDSSGNRFWVPVWK